MQVLRFASKTDERAFQLELAQQSRDLRAQPAMGWQQMMEEEVHVWLPSQQLHRPLCASQYDSDVCKAEKVHRTSMHSFC